MQSAVLAATIAIGAAIATPALAGGHSEAEKAIAAAKAAYRQALDVGGAWRDTDKMIEQAEKLMKAGKTEQAMRLAEEAEAQAMLGHIQATRQTRDKLHIN